MSEELTLQENYELLKECHDDHYQSMLSLGKELGECLDALEALCDAIEKRYKSLKASDMRAADLDYDGSGDDWKEYVEPIIMVPYEQGRTTLDYHSSEQKFKRELAGA